MYLLKTGHTPGDSRVGSIFWPQSHNLSKLRCGLLGDAKVLNIKDLGLVVLEDCSEYQGPRPSGFRVLF